MICKYARTYRSKINNNCLIVGCNYLDKRFHMEENPCDSCVLRINGVVKTSLTMCSTPDEVEKGDTL